MYTHSPESAWIWYSAEFRELSSDNEAGHKEHHEKGALSAHEQKNN